MIRTPRLLSFFAVIAVFSWSLRLSWAAENVDSGKKGGAAKPAKFLPPEACRKCHPQHYEEWRGSMHAYSFEDPVFFAMNHAGQKDTDGQLGDFCVRCHSPLGALTGEVKPSIRSPKNLSAIARSGISCEVCHRDVRQTPGHPENFNLELRAGGPMIGGIDDPVPTEFHGSKKSDLLRKPEFCGSCHNVTNHRGVRVEKPADEYAKSPFPDRLTTCVT
ncbi:MAG: multiheme c-type cytochrome, partial [Planctomycetota bacterium]